MRPDRTIRLFTLIAALPPASVAVAQDDAGGMPEPMHAEHARERGEMDHAHVHRAKDVPGAEVRNESGETVGKLEDVVIDTATGRLALALVAPENVSSDAVRVLPWRALRVVVEPSDAADEHACHLMLRGDASRLAAAPTLAGDEELSEELWRRTEGLFGAADAKRFERQGAGAPLVRAADLRGCAVHGPKDDRIADVEVVFVDVDAGCVACLQLGTGGVLGVGEKEIAVPWGALKASRTPEDDALRLSLAMNEERLAQAPEIPDDAKRVGDREWMRTVYRFYSETPYWEAGARPASSERAMGDRAKGEMKKIKKDEMKKTKEKGSGEQGHGSGDGHVGG